MPPSGRARAPVWLFENMSWSSSPRRNPTMGPAFGAIVSGDGRPRRGAPAPRRLSPRLGQPLGAVPRALGQQRPGRRPGVRMGCLLLCAASALSRFLGSFGTLCVRSFCPGLVVVARSGFARGGVGHFSENRYIRILFCAALNASIFEGKFISRSDDLSLAHSLLKSEIACSQFVGCSQFFAATRAQQPRGQRAFELLSL